MSKELETLQEILAASKRLEEQLIARQTRIEELERENQNLRRQCEEAGRALNAYLSDSSAGYIDEIHAQLDPSTQTGVDFEHVMNELQAVYQKHD
jgi:DNA repair exonuclease SbcCD ATPase subunit